MVILLVLEDVNVDRWEEEINKNMRLRGRRY